MPHIISARQFYAETYDTCVSDWSGEIDFYREIATAAVNVEDGVVLELACGTGRIAIRLVQSGVSVVGLDRSPEMLAVAMRKSTHNKYVHWIEADMRDFELDQRFDLVIIPDHSFHNLNSADDQYACLNCVRDHLVPGGTLVVHLDHMNSHNMCWLGEISGEKGGIFEEAERFKHPLTGNQVQTKRAWSYETATQTAILQTVWEEFDDNGEVTNLWDTGLIKLHCVFRFEMEHLLERAGFEMDHLYGDFYRGELQNDSTEMIWIASRGNNPDTEHFGITTDRKRLRS